MKPLVYVAGPITGDPFGCVGAAAEAWSRLREIGCVPFLPQMSVLHQMVDPQPYETWIDYDQDVIRHCDALLRMEGRSPGADSEVEFATSLGLPVFFGPHLTFIEEWAARWTSRFGDRAVRREYV